MKLFLNVRGLVSAVRTLTLVPLPGHDAAGMDRALPWFPLVGFSIGAALFGLAALGQKSVLATWPEGTAFLVVTTGAVLTRGLHLDGLADTADGFFSMTTREKTLAIMKDSRVGTFGVLALLLILGLKWVALTRLVAHRAPLWILPATITSRTAMVALASTLPYARKEGGTGAPFVAGATLRHHLTAWLFAALLLAPLGPLMPCTLLPGGLAILLLRAVYKRRVGGVTGDLLGAASELIETLYLALAAALLPKLSLLHPFEVPSW